jgi:SecD/SecF fusion protein
MKNHFGRFLLVFVIVGLSALAYFHKPPDLGLDLKGGSSLTYQAKAAEGSELTQEHLKRAIDVIEGRLNATGVAEISLTPTEAKEIVVELPGRTADQIKDIKALIQRNGQLEFRIQAEPTVERKAREEFESSGGLVNPTADYKWVPRKEAGAPKMLVRTPEKPIENQLNKILRKLQDASPEYKEAKRKLDEVAGRDDVTPTQRAKLKADVDAVMKQLEAGSEDAKSTRLKYEEMVRSEVFTGEQLESTEIRSQNMKTVVAFSFKDERKPWFGQFTEKHIKEQMAIILDGTVDSAPVINSKLPGDGIIEGGGATGFNPAEAKALAIVLESGSTGIQLNLSREESLGPSLGEVAIRHGLWSVIVGFILVVSLMVFYYRLPGMVANFALLLNLVILMGVMAFFRAALTLPGIAGIVLTLGMAVDANILIFERYREERHRGKSVPDALAAGYDRAFSAIIDTHATTILTAVVLIIMGTGSVKGFGVSLTVGLIASFFTAFFVTRWIFEWAIEKGIATNLTLGADKKTPTIDFMGKRKWFTGPSFVLMIVGAIGYLARDDYSKRDLEFVGGQEAILHLKSAIAPDEADKLVKADARYEDASIVSLQAEGVPAEAGKTNRFRVRAKAANQVEGEVFVAFLATSFKDLLVAQPFSELKLETLKPSGVKATLAVHFDGDAGDPAAFKTALASEGFADPDVQKDAADASVLRLTVSDTAITASADTVRARVGEAVKKLQPKVSLSDPFPSKSFLEKSRAEDLYRSAVGAILVSLLIQVIYIRLRYANYNYGVAAVIAVAHDVPIALGAVTLFDATGLVYAKVNLVLIAAFLTLIGYSMNDTIVVFDRIREDLGRSKVIRSSLVNEAINQTIVRSIRTSMTVFIVVLVQFLFSHGTGSVLEGFAFVMVVGVVSGTYSSIFMAAPLLLFLPHYAKKLTANHLLFAAMLLATLVGSVMTLRAESGTPLLWAGALLAFNIPIHFLVHIFPWLGHANPDEFIQDQIEQEADERPLDKPGI